MRFPATAIVAAISLLTAIPPVPPLPSGGWPTAEVAEPFTRDLMARVTPAQLEAELTANPELLPPLFRNLGTALLSRDAALQKAVADYATMLARAHAVKTDNAQSIVTYMVIDPLRYGEDEEFRRAIDAILPRSLPPTLPLARRRAA